MALERMSKIQIAPEYQDREEPLYARLDPIVSTLLASGNELTRSERWGSTNGAEDIHPTISGNAVLVTP